MSAFSCGYSFELYYCFQERFWTCSEPVYFIHPVVTTAPSLKNYRRTPWHRQKGLQASMATNTVVKKHVFWVLMKCAGIHTAKLCRSQMNSFLLLEKLSSILSRMPAKQACQQKQRGLWYRWVSNSQPAAWYCWLCVLCYPFLAGGKHWFCLCNKCNRELLKTLHNLRMEEKLHGYFIKVEQQATELNLQMPTYRNQQKLWIIFTAVTPHPAVWNL